MSLLVSLVDDLHEKRTTESQHIRNFDSARVLFVIFTRVTTLHPCYMKSAIVLSQIDARNFYSGI